MNIRLVLVALSCVASALPGQQLNWSDGFETYNPGYLCYQSPAVVPSSPCANVGNSGGWDGWFNNPIDAGIVVNAPGMGNGGSDQYLDVSPALACQDAVQPFVVNATTSAGAASGAPYTTYPASGSWTVTAHLRVPAGGLASGQVYVMVQNAYNNAGTNTSWAIQCSMEQDPANPASFIMQDDMRSDPATGANYTYSGIPYDTWFGFRAVICLDTDSVNLFLDLPAPMGSIQFSEGVFAATGGPVEIATLNLSRPEASCGRMTWQSWQRRARRRRSQ